MRVSHTRGIRRVTVVVVATLAVLYAVNLGRLVVANQRAAGVENTLATQVAGDLAAIEELETETARAGSEGFVEEYARDELGWAQSGDRVLQPVEDDSPAVGPSPLEPQAPTQGFWERMRRWFGASGAGSSEESDGLPGSSDGPAADGAPASDDAGTAGSPAPLTGVPTSEQAP